MVLTDKTRAVEVVVEDRMWGVLEDNSVNCGVKCDVVVVVLDGVIRDDPSLQSLSIATLSSFINRQSKLGLSLALTSRNFGKD